MSEQHDILFEVNVKDSTVNAVGIPLDVDLTQLKIIINDVDINRNMKITSLKILKVLK